MTLIIKNIIFDLGGVLLNLDYSLTTKAFQKIAPDFGSFDAIYAEQKDKKLFEDFETGAITSRQFRNGIRGLLQNNIDDKTINEAWNAMLLDFPIERLRLLEKLRLKYRLFLLSNTNEIHLEAVNEILNKNFGLKDLSGIFEKEYYSHKVGMRKPNKEIFQLVISENKLNPSETLFIDDSVHHIEGGKCVGLHTLLMAKDKVLADELLTLNL
ncbi:MAG: HAD family phosphatase [Bacteroidetes bacterium]|nr:HAD family phosphatase [Bacteroidota bacterium]